MTTSTPPANPPATRQAPGLDRRLSVAPMLDWTDRHCRYFLRLISTRVLLYTEMVTTGALLHGDRARFLRFDPAERPLALQLAGADPHALAECARMGADWGYDEINFNLGCPSDRVQNGGFGACLMAEPARVADCIAAMKSAVALPVTVKTRIGIDDRDSEEELTDLVRTLAAAGCDAFIIHARKAWLSGLSPKDNRDVPPLRYDWVERLKARLPELSITLNGGITDLNQAEHWLKRLDGVMIGRAAYHDPYLLAAADQRIFGLEHTQAGASEDGATPTRHRIIAAYLPYVEHQLAADVPLTAMSRHLLGLFQGQPGARAWRRHLSTYAHRPGATVEVLREALRAVPDRSP